METVTLKAKRLEHRRKTGWKLMILAVEELEGVVLEVSLHFSSWKLHLLNDMATGLRQAPPPRQLFQPDLSSSRQTRHSSGHHQSPQPTAAAHTGYNYASSNPNSASFAIANYEPRPPMPLTLRPILTPGNNPALFNERLRLAREARKIELGLISPSTKGMMKPGGKCSPSPC